MQAHYVYIECKESLPALDLLELLGHYIIYRLTLCCGQGWSPLAGQILTLSKRPILVASDNGVSQKLLNSTKPEECLGDHI